MLLKFKPINIQYKCNLIKWVIKKNWLIYEVYPSLLYFLESFSFLAHRSRRLKWVFLIEIYPLSYHIIRYHVNLTRKYNTKLSNNKKINIPGARFKSNGALLFKNILFHKHWASFIQTWHKSSLAERNASFLKWRGMPFSKGR